MMYDIYDMRDGFDVQDVLDTVIHLGLDGSS